MDAVAGLFASAAWPRTAGPGRGRGGGSTDGGGESDTKRRGGRALRRRPGVDLGRQVFPAGCGRLRRRDRVPLADAAAGPGSRGRTARRPPAGPRGPPAPSLAGGEDAAPDPLPRTAAGRLPLAGEAGSEVRRPSPAPSWRAPQAATGASAPSTPHQPPRRRFRTPADYCPRRVTPTTALQARPLIFPGYHCLCHGRISLPWRLQTLRAAPSRRSWTGISQNARSVVPGLGSLVVMSPSCLASRRPTPSISERDSLP